MNLKKVALDTYQLLSIGPTKRFVCAHTERQCFPQKDHLRHLIREISYFVFPDYYPPNPELDGADRLIALGEKLKEQVLCGMCFNCRANDSSEQSDVSLCSIKAEKIASEFIQFLPQLRNELHQDAEASYLGDPAATSIDEVIFTYPGLVSMLHHRIAHFLYTHSVPIIPRFISEICHAKTGIDIHPGAKIAPGVFIDHGTGIVIGETAIIGNGVRIYQGVTLGAKSFPTDEFGHPIKGIPRHPIIEDEVILYAGATVLGRITLGKGCVIGGNLWVTDDVPAGVMLSQKLKE